MLVLRLEALRLAASVAEMLNQHEEGDALYDEGDILTIAGSFWDFVTACGMEIEFEPDPANFHFAEPEGELN